MDKLLDKKMQDLTVREFLIVSKLAKKNKKELVLKEPDGALRELINNNYERSPFDKPITKFADIYDNLSDKHIGLYKKALALELRAMGFTHKIKRIQGTTTTAHFYGVRLKNIENEQ